MSWISHQEKQELVIKSEIKIIEELLTAYKKKRSIKDLPQSVQRIVLDPLYEKLDDKKFELENLYRQNEIFGQ